MNPAGFKDFRPMNPWGRGMPRSQRKPAAERLDLWQCWVETRSGKVMPFGPKMSAAVISDFIAAINQQIMLGRERKIGKAYCLPAAPLRRH